MPNNRCPNCVKFVSLEQEDPPQIDDFEVDLEGHSISVEATLHLQCADCSSDVSEASVSVDVDFEQPILDHLAEAGPHELIFDDEPDAEVHDEYGGDASTPLRYRPHLYGFSLTVNFKCKNHSDWHYDQTVSESEQGSNFELC